MNHFSFSIVFIIFLGIFAWGCEKGNIPEVSTFPVTDITQSTAGAGGEIISDGGATVRSHGVCWSTSPNPTVSGSKTDLGKSGGGSFTSVITGLSPSTTYYVRAYATNKAGTGYGDEVVFTTVLSDIDGNVYQTVKIGDQIWMAENLRTTKFRNGNGIDYPGTNITTWYGNTSGAYAWYDNDTANRKIYGALYNWNAVKSASGICPAGWRIPSDEEWTAMVNHLGGEGVAGSKLKEAGNTHWNQPNTDATNESGFTALPAGLRDEQGNYGHLQWSGFFWTSTQYNLGNGWARSLNANVGTVTRLYTTKPTGYSVRCIKD